MVSLRFRDAEQDNELLIYKTVKVISELKTEEEKTMIRNRFDKISKVLVPESDVSMEFEDFKLKHDEEINKLKCKYREDEAKYEKEKGDLLNQRIEIEQKLLKLKDEELISYEIKLILLKSIISNF